MSTFTRDAVAVQHRWSCPGTLAAEIVALVDGLPAEHAPDALALTGDTVALARSLDDGYVLPSGVTDDGRERLLDALALLRDAHRDAAA